MQDKEFQKLQDALLQRIMSSKHSEERERFLNMHRRLLRQKRLMASRVMEEHGQQGKLL